MNRNFNKQENLIINSNPEFQQIISSLENDYSLSIRKMTHEFGNALTLINSSLQIIESSHPKVKDYKYWSETIGDVHYLVNLISELSFFNNSNKLNLEITDLFDMLQSILSSYENTDTSGKINLTLSAAESVPCIMADATKLKQVFINLIKNACEALDTSQSNPFVHIDLHKNNNSVIIDIIDNGCGISPEHLDNIFSPMVSYKSNGTGLGLPISKKIIESHKGSITITSKAVKGTVFTITLPL